MLELVAKKSKAPVGPVVNFEDVKAALAAELARFENVDFSSLEPAKLQEEKSNIRKYRTSLEKTDKLIKEEYFTGPRRVYDAKVKELYELIASIETKVDEVIAEEEAIRHQQVQAALDIYKAELQKKYLLPEAYLARVEYKKAYFNKTSKEVETKTDLRAQFETLSAEYEERLQAEEMIRKGLAGEPRINAEEQIRKLDAGVGLATILSFIEAEKKRLFDLDNPEPVPQNEEYAKTIDVEVVGIPAEELRSRVPSLFPKESDFVRSPSEVLTKKMVIEIEYPADFANELNELFRELKTKGIKAVPYKP